MPIQRECLPEFWPNPLILNVRALVAMRDPSRVLQAIGFFRRKVEARFKQLETDRRREAGRCRTATCDGGGCRGRECPVCKWRSHTGPDRLPENERGDR